MPYSKFFCGSLLLSCSSTLWAQQTAIPENADSALLSTATTSIETPLSQTAAVNSEQTRLIDKLPQAIENLPTLLPPESNISITPTTIETQDASWFDQQHQRFSNWIDRSAHEMDGWFGQTEENEPATASIRIISDQRWNKYDEFEVKPRIRGRLKLPTLERKVSVVFGDDSLDNELEESIAINNEHQLEARPSDKTLDSRSAREDNASIALRWSNFNKRLPFDTDIDLGVRSLDDVYIRLKAAKKWDIGNDYNIYAEQIYRYGIDSKNYLRTNLQITHAAENKAFISNQMSLLYTDDFDNEMLWENRLFRQHQFFHHNRFNYGLYVAGHIADTKADLNAYGPFMMWRQPFLREWFFVQSEVNYLNDRRLDQSHHVGLLLRLEANF